MQSYAPPPGAVQAPAPAFYPSTPQVPFYPAAPTPPPPQFVQTQAPQFRPQPWTPPAPQMPVPQMRVPVPTAAPPQAPVQQMPYNVQPGMPIHFQVPAGMAPSNFGYYGYAPDQMWSALAAVPPMWRPQQPGETFARRWAVNTGLNAVETILQQLLIGVRQMFMPPAPPRQMQGPVIDVTPS